MQRCVVATVLRCGAVGCTSVTPEARRALRRSGVSAGTRSRERDRNLTSTMYRLQGTGSGAQ
ncbi:MAG: hypothetical protein MI924_05165 [Chloroflexales bacterium]|nr:hypothetical protein [Chloroflexales bacterium]